MKILEHLVKLSKENLPFAMATIVKTEGSTPGKIGFKILIEGRGSTYGTIGGGALEREVIQEGLRRIGTGHSGMMVYLLGENINHDLQKDTDKAIPMMCNGKVWVYYEITGQNKSVYIFGGGHVGMALSFFLNHLPYKVILIDNREEFTNPVINPYVNELVHQDYKKYCNEFVPEKNALIVIMTHGHSFDYEILKIIFSRKLPISYIGVIASKTKAAQLIDKLRVDLGEDIDLSKFYSPVGLDLGGNTPAEIALSIAAEIQAIVYGKKGVHLSTDK